VGGEGWVVGAAPEIGVGGGEGIEAEGAEGGSTEERVICPDRRKPTSFRLAKIRSSCRPHEEVSCERGCSGSYADQRRLRRRGEPEARHAVDVRCSRREERRDEGSFPRRCGHLPP